MGGRLLRQGDAQVLTGRELQANRPVTEYRCGGAAAPPPSLLVPHLRRLHQSCLPPMRQRRAGSARGRYRPPGIQEQSRRHRPLSAHPYHLSQLVVDGAQLIERRSCDQGAPSRSGAIRRGYWLRPTGGEHRRNHSKLSTNIWYRRYGIRDTQVFAGCEAGARPRLPRPVCRNAAAADESPRETHTGSDDAIAVRFGSHNRCRGQRSC